MTDRKRLNTKGYGQLTGLNLLMLIEVLRATLDLRGIAVNHFVAEVNDYWGVKVIARSSIYNYLLKPPTFLSPRMALALAPKLHIVTEARMVGSKKIICQIHPIETYANKSDDLMNLGDLLYGQGSRKSPWGDFVHAWMKRTGTSKPQLIRILRECTLIPPGRAEDLISGLAQPTDTELVFFGSVVRPSAESLYTLDELRAFSTGARQLASCG